MSDFNAGAIAGVIAILMVEACIIMLLFGWERR